MRPAWGLPPAGGKLLQHFGAGNAKLDAPHVGGRQIGGWPRRTEYVRAEMLTYSSALNPFSSMRELTKSRQASEVTRLTNCWFWGAPKGDVDDIGRRSKRREVGDGVLGDLNDALLHFVGEFFARAQFFVGGEVDIDFAAGEVLHILLKVQLHHRIGARRSQRVGGGESQGIFGVFLRRASSLAVWASAAGVMASAAAVPAPPSTALCKNRRRPGWRTAPPPPASPSLRAAR